MKQIFKKYSALILVIIMIFSVCMYYSVQKQGMFVDEIHTFGLSNSYYAPFISDANHTVPYINSVLTQEQINAYLTVDESDAFAFGSVYYNQAADVHPPLHYWLFNIASSLYQGVYSKWPGLILDGILYAIALMIFYKLCMELFGSKKISTVALAIYGISHMGVSTMLMIRMYALLTLLTLLLLYLIIKLVKNPKVVYYPLIGMTILLGLMTQYYYVFYAFFVCFSLCVYLLVKKDYKKLALFSISAVLGVAALFIVFPPFINQLFSDSVASGGTAAENLKTTSMYIPRIITFSKMLIHGLKAAVLIAIACVVLCVAFGKKLIERFKKRDINLMPLLFIIPAVVDLLVVAILSPVDETRYIYNIAPVFVIAVAWLISILEKHVNKKVFTIALIVTVCLSLEVIATSKPDYLYPEHAEYDKAVQAHSSAPCIYFFDRQPYHMGPVTQDVLQLRFFDDVFLAENDFSDSLREYIQNHDNNEELVIYISTDAFWGSGYKSEDIIELVCDNSQYTTAERLYQYGLSDTYVLR